VNLTAAGLDELLAPIALYPDPVLAVMLQAAVDPQQVMDGGNWLVQGDNAKLKEAALDQASKQAGFTPVMQALLHYAPVVDMMCTQFDWTKQLGAAYQADPRAVLDSVQRLRAQAVDNGALKSSPQMKVDVKQENGQQVVQLEPTDPKVVYVPQYNPDQVYSQTTTTTTRDGTTTTTTTTTGTAPVTSTSSTNTVVVQQQKSGVDTGTAVLIGLLSFGAGMAVGAAINNNNYYYPAWGYGGIYYGGRPYYPPPYRPVYYPGYHGGYHYNRPVHYGNNNIYIQNNNYYNRFNNNNNLNANYRPKPVPYNDRPGSTYSNSMGNRPGGNKGVTYQGNKDNNNYRGQTTYQGTNDRPSNNASVQNRPGGANASNNANTGQRPATGNLGNTNKSVQQPATGGNNNWKGQSGYQGANKGVANAAASTRDMNRGGTNTSPTASNRMANTNNTLSRNTGGGDRGYAPTGARPNTSGNAGARPSTGNASASRPTTSNQPMNKPAAQPSGGAFGGASNAKADRTASNRGKASMGANPQSKPAPARQSSKQR